MAVGVSKESSAQHDEAPRHMLDAGNGAAIQNNKCGGINGNMKLHYGESSFWSKIYILQSYISFLYSQDIKLLELEHKDCVTKCASGFLNYVDKLVFKSVINFTQQSNDFIFSTYMIKETAANDYKKLFHIHPETVCVARNDLDYYCEKTGENIFHVFATLQAQPQYNGAKIKAVLSDGNKYEISSDYQIFPKSYDTKNATGTITINGDNYYFDDCRTNISINDLQLQFVCSSPATPCLIEILTDDSENVATFNDSAVLRRTLSSQQSLLVNIKFAACRLDMDFNNFSCIIQANTENTTMPFVTVVVITGSVIQLVTACLVAFIIQRSRKNKQKKDKQNRELKSLLPNVIDGKENMINLDKSTLTDIYGINIILKCEFEI